ncbi:hypothetical protein WR164_01530 [Philodulcilactobacillus myokoensis]|uniref:Uncharacterized protein n=1 Tax=Philodulcilactobacillus myokoensis TaxID=2929573 RepID=A0A9W6AYW5_9LACO|nr:hypothetical protein [Philodulcilactobacillus myokoensis]GLB46174.1 hypothetical protein WR164_01530 [Philodulcilactobacillus myokoensis]
MNFKKYLFSILASVAFLLTIVSFTATPAHASYQGHYTTPTELRGRWYRYNQYEHKYDIMTVKKHSVTVNNFKINRHDHHDGNTHFLYVKTCENGLNHHKGLSYTITGKQDAKKGAPIIYWSAKLKNGQRSLKVYTNMGYFSQITTWTRHKVHHDTPQYFDTSNWLAK